MTDEDVAIKVLPIIHDPHDQKMVQRKNSIQYRELDHANIVKYHDCWEQGFSFLPVKIQWDLMELLRRRDIKSVFCFKRSLYNGKNIL